MHSKEISSQHNPSIKQLILLKERRHREKTQLFIIEGYREIFRALLSGMHLEQLFLCEAFFLGDNEEALINEAAKKGSEILRCSAALFEKISYRDRPDGLLAIAKQKHSFLDRLDEELGKKRQQALPPLFIAAEAIEKPGNLGTILRSADAAGVDAFILCNRCTDLHNPNVVRASVGTLFTVPIVEAESDALLDWCDSNDIAIVAATPSAETLYTDADLTVPLLIAVGTEQLGLSKQWLERAKISVKIPMAGVADSLNVATATTLLLFEAVRQRATKKV